MKVFLTVKIEDLSGQTSFFITCHNASGGKIREYTDCYDKISDVIKYM